MPKGPWPAGPIYLPSQHNHRPDDLEAIPGTWDSGPWDSGKGWNEHRRGTDAKSQGALNPDITRATESVWAATKLAFSFFLKNKNKQTKKKKNLSYMVIAPSGWLDSKCVLNLMRQGMCT